MNALDVPKVVPWGLDAPPRRSAPEGLARTFVEIALTIGALLGVVIAGFTMVAAHNGMRPLVVRSGSMEPTIRTGSMVLVKRLEAADIKVGDVLTVERPDHTRVTHRVVAIEHNGVTALLTLKGDANEDPDPVPIPVQYAHRVVAQVPVIGRAMAWLATAPGGFFLGCVSTLAARHMLRLRRSEARRRSVDGSVAGWPEAAALEPVEPAGNATGPARPGLSWIGLVLEERLADRRSQTPSPIDERIVGHAA
jgi:signal peptidase I